MLGTAISPEPEASTVGHGVLFRRRNRIKGFVGIPEKPALPEITARAVLEQPLHQVSAAGEVFDLPERIQKLRNARILRVLAHC